MGSTELSEKRRHSTVNVIGGSSGLIAAIEIAELAYQLRTKISVRVFEAGIFGGDSRDKFIATPRSHLWFQRGQFYVKTQPAVSLALRWSTERLQRWAPHAFLFPLAFSLDTIGDLAAYYQSLGVWHEPISMTVFRTWFPQLRLPSWIAGIYRIEDGLIDLPLLAHSLMLKAHQLDIEFVQQRVDGLKIHNATVHALTLADGTRVPVTSSDDVVLACGARIPEFLRKMDVHVDGLTVSQSHLISANLGVPAMLTVIGGLNIIPHNESGRGGLVNILGNAHRIEVPLDPQASPPQPDTQAIESVCQDAAEFGLHVPRDQMVSWLGLKTEIVTEGSRNQSHQACLLPDVANAWLAIPGKLSASASCGYDLARKILRRKIGTSVATPIWEMLAGDREEYKDAA